MAPEQANYLYRQISLQLISAFPGKVYLRLETWAGPATMIEVLPGDIVNISKLGDREAGSGERVTRAMAPETIRDVCQARHGNPDARS